MIVAQMFSEVKFSPIPPKGWRAGTANVPGKCMGWNGSGWGAGSHSFTPRGANCVKWGKEALCAEPGCAAVICVPASDRWSIHDVLPKPGGCTLRWGRDRSCCKCNTGPGNKLILNLWNFAGLICVCL